MKLSATTLRRRILVAATLLGWASVAFAADEKPQDQALAASAQPGFSPQNTFRNICGFCHADYGRHAGKGPQLMHSERSDDYLFNRIKNGKAGRMAAFGGAFSDDQIREIVAFIRTLRPDQEP